jgi:hypothetical protein
MHPEPESGVVHSSIQGPHMSKLKNKPRNTIHDNLIRVRAGFVAKERAHVVETLSTLRPHLGTWDSRDVNVDVSLQDRGGNAQCVVLSTSLRGLRPLVAVAKDPDIGRALSDARRELIRQIDHLKSAGGRMNSGRFPLQRSGAGDRIRPVHVPAPQPLRRGR